MCTCTCVLVYVYTYTYTRTYKYMCAHRYFQLYAYMHTYMRIDLRTRAYAHALMRTLRSMNRNAYDHPVRVENEISVHEDDVDGQAPCTWVPT